MDRDFSMAMDGYISACVEEEMAINRYFLLPDMENHHAYMRSASARRDMLKVLLERHADYIVHVVEEFRGSIGKEIDAITKRLDDLERPTHQSAKDSNNDATS